VRRTGIVSRNAVRPPAKPGAEGRGAGRRGAILVVALVCLGVAAVVFVAVLKTAAAERRSLQTEARRVQAAWLAESAVDRAAARLAVDPAYPGETWTVPPGVLNDFDSARVVIEVQPPSEQEPHRRLVRVQADWPNHPQHRVRQTRQVLIELHSSP